MTTAPISQPALLPRDSDSDTLASGVSDAKSGASLGRDNDTGSEQPATGGFLSRVSRALSPGRAPEPSTRGIYRTMEEPRGRDPLISTGRGGAGNLVRSLSAGPDEGVPGAERGRELREPSLDRATHSGRGGAGNIRSPSRDPTRAAIDEAQEDALQDALIAERRGRQADQPFLSGRGGAGNISDSRSRSRSAARASPTAGTGVTRVPSSSRTRAPLQHGGRGGYGNITEEAGEEELARAAAEDAYEARIKAAYDAEDATHPKTHGRGGAGSLRPDLPPADAATTAAESLAEREAYAKFAADERKAPIRGGRGGAGNIVARDDRGRDATSPSGGGGGVFGSMFRSLSRAARGAPAEPPREQAKS